LQVYQALSWRGADQINFSGHFCNRHSTPTTIVFSAAPGTNPLKTTKGGLFIKSPFVMRLLALRS
jgi:hypothetical protein